MKSLLLSAALMSLGGMASAHGAAHEPAPAVPASQAHHADGHSTSPAGALGEAALATRVVEISMYETDNEMLFEPRAMRFDQGETIRLSVRNEGVIAHELVIDTAEGNLRHKVTMAAGMEDGTEAEHQEENAILLEPGETGELVWTFTEAGVFEFACLLPGHQELGMSGPIEVSALHTTEE